MGSCLFCIPLFLYFLAISIAPFSVAEDDRLEWLGDRHAAGWVGPDSIPTMTQFGQATAPELHLGRVTQLSWHPRADTNHWYGSLFRHPLDPDLSRAFLYDGFLSEEECDHLIELANNTLEKSKVADHISGESIPSEVRTSSGMFLTKQQDEIVKAIEERIAKWTFLPEENGESIQVLRYKIGEKYEPHYDYFHDKVNLQMGGHRIATVLMYLSNVTKGGETVFTKAQDAHVKVDDDSLSECAMKGVAVKPKKGDALLFFSLFPDATTDPLSLHGSCPVIEGEKWSATKWIHVDSFSKRMPATCEDQNEYCTKWAESGECTNNQEYMVGSEEAPGNCRKSCKACDASNL